jgi:DNA-binding transcriptional LysR family regulator
MAVVARVVEAGGFSGAARALGISASAVSKVVSRLEARLGTRLFRRSTRRLALTPEGEAFHARATVILAEIESAEREAGGANLPAGRVRINSSSSYVTHVLAPILPEFLRRYPDIAIDIVQTDALADLVAERSDLAIRAGPLADSSLFARPLGETPIEIAAAPAWIERHGMPASLKDLIAHDQLGFAYARSAGAWLQPSREAPERIRVSDGEGIRQLALAGVAPARLAGFSIRADLAAGRLVRLLPDLLPKATEAFHVVYVGRSEMLPHRVRIFLDLLGSRGLVD